MSGERCFAILPADASSLKHARQGVKATLSLGQQKPKGRGYRRHLEGWQLGLLAVSFALLALALVMPRPAHDPIVPLPRLDHQEEQRARVRRADALERARRRGLPFSVRAVGEAVRRYGRAETTHDGPQLGSALAHLRRTVLLARQDSKAELLLELGAVQTELFLTALGEWEATGKQTAELVELGGTFSELAEKFGWMDPKRRLRLDEAERAVLFEFRWLELLGLREERAFSPSLDEWRRYFRCLLQYPQTPGGLRGPDSARVRLDYVTALMKVDAEYPAALAKGMLHQQLGESGDAQRELAAHLSAHPHGAWSLRARNHWLATFEP